jgi:hypothetical protein
MISMGYRLTMCYMCRLSTVQAVVNRVINCYVLPSVPRLLMIIDAAGPLLSSPQGKAFFPGTTGMDPEQKRAGGIETLYGYCASY